MVFFTLFELTEVEIYIGTKGTDVSGYKLSYNPASSTERRTAENDGCSIILRVGSTLNDRIIVAGSGGLRKLLL